MDVDLLWVVQFCGRVIDLDQVRSRGEIVHRHQIDNNLLSVLTPQNITHLTLRIIELIIIHLDITLRVKQPIHMIILIRIAVHIQTLVIQYKNHIGLILATSLWPIVIDVHLTREHLLTNYQRLGRVRVIKRILGDISLHLRAPIRLNLQTQLHQRKARLSRLPHLLLDP